MGGVMTDSEKLVRKQLGGGGSCWSAFGDSPMIYRIWSRALPGSEDERSILLGRGPSQKAAWDDAAAKIALSEKVVMTAEDLKDRVNASSHKIIPIDFTFLEQADEAYSELSARTGEMETLKAQLSETVEELGKEKVLREKCEAALQQVLPEVERMRALIVKAEADLAEVRERVSEFEVAIVQRDVAVPELAALKAETQITNSPDEFDHEECLR